MPKMYITTALASKLEYEGKGPHTAYRDSELTGFMLLAYRSGKKSWAIDYRQNGRRQTYVLGPYPILSPAQARQIAKDTITRIRAGIDPKSMKDTLCVDEFCDIYIQRHAKAKKKSWTQDDRNIKLYVSKRFGKLALTNVSRRDVTLLHQKIGKTAPYQANRILALIRKMWHCAEAWGYTPEGHPNPAVHIEPYKEHTRDRWVTQDEMKKLLLSIAANENKVIRAVILMYLLTGMRKTELLGLTWSQIDFSRKEIRLPDPKQGRVHYVQLTESAIAVLKDLDQSKLYVFPGRRKNRPLVNVSKHWMAIKTAAGLVDVRLHDLRRTLGSWLAQQGASLHLIGAVLGHSNASTTQIYARFGVDNIKKALEDYDGKLKEVTSLSTLDVVQGRCAQKSDTNQSLENQQQELVSQNPVDQ